jgi:nitrite reductase/ring-hydroxylating ferredoxin subunit
MRTTADGLTRQLRSAGYHIHTFSVSSTGDYAVADADWNYKDVPHLNVVHTKVRCAVGTMDDELITTLAMQKVFGIELPIVIVNFVSSDTSQTYYTTLGPFALVVYTEYFELEPNKTKVVTTYNIAGGKIFKLLFPLLQRVLTGNYKTLMSEDLPMRDRRGELRARGFDYKTDGKPRTFPDTVDVNFLNLVVPPRTSTNTETVKMDALGADGERVLVGESDDRGLCLVRQGDDVLLLPRFCNHEGAKLDCASLKNGRLSCPWHGKLVAPLGKLAATEGSSWESGAYSARIQDGEVVVGFPGER